MVLSECVHSTDFLSALRKEKFQRLFSSLYLSHLWSFFSYQFLDHDDRFQGSSTMIVGVLLSLRMLSSDDELWQLFKDLSLF